MKQEDVTFTKQLKFLKEQVNDLAMNITQADAHSKDPVEKQTFITEQLGRVDKLQELITSLKVNSQLLPLVNMEQQLNEIKNFLSNYEDNAEYRKADIYETPYAKRSVYELKSGSTLDTKKRHRSIKIWELEQQNKSLEDKVNDCLLYTSDAADE
eukprot:TRINITY_DN17259_c0_g4_i2.p1 TRINITY_DN17259_c0_g4~~TRINITY_DN17259_c0_g4_i2.p1  ORF type:complete len:155 (-),score=24.08 TRINITY_DN17259_c0_g4_i2:28-492(-)